jgi:hypothetical protein
MVFRLPSLRTVSISRIIVITESTESGAELLPPAGNKKAAPGMAQLFCY